MRTQEYAFNDDRSFSTDGSCGHPLVPLRVAMCAPRVLARRRAGRPKKWVENPLEDQSLQRGAAIKFSGEHGCIILAVNLILADS